MSQETASKPRIKISWILWTLLAFLLFAVIAAYSSRMTSIYSNYDKQRATERYATLAKLREEEHQTLTTADWVDLNKGTVRIPIAEAMVKEVDTLKNKPVAMGGLLSGVAPAPAPAANPAPATNAAPAAPAPSAKPTPTPTPKT